MEHYNDGNIDPEVLDFYRPTHRKHHSLPHHHQPRQAQAQQGHYATHQHEKSQHHPSGNHQPQRHHASGGSDGGAAAQQPHPITASLRAADLVPLLRERLAILPGGRDRRGGPLICFPINSKAQHVPLEELYLLVRYLTFLPEERSKKLGFTAIFDMRSGTAWHSVKPLLKVLDECVGDSVEIAYIIKPDKFLEKQKAHMAANKYSFEVQLISVENLFREVDPSQLTSDFEGSLPYNHMEWIQIRVRLEEFFTLAHDMSDKFGQLFQFLDRKDTPENVIEAKTRLEEHRSVRLKVVQAPVHVLEAEADRLTHWLRCGIASNQSASAHGAAGAAYLGTSWVCMNPDFQQLAPQVKQTVAQLYEFRAHLQQKWEAGRARLEQIYQLRLFEDDVGRMSAWLDQQRHLFLTEYLDIGQTAAQAADLYAEHRQFLSNCSNVREQVSRLSGVAGMLADTGHFASQQILTQASQLEHEWKSFTTALEDRSRVLQLSASFHARAEAFLANCPHWEAAMRQISAESVPELNQAVINLQDLWQEAQSAHEEVCSDGRALANHLSSPVPSGSHTSLTAAVDYSEGRRHCTDLVHELWSWFKRMELVYNERKKRLSSRLALLMFKEDVSQVLAWLTDHGEPFLARQAAVGKSSQRAEQLYNAHMQFEQVAANTLTNAEKLISAADDLAAQAEDPEEILQGRSGISGLFRQEATELQRRINAFTNAVEERRDTLDLACGFYGHTKELFTWFHHLRESHNPGEHLPSTIEGMEEELANFHRDRATVEASTDRVLTEGEALLERVRDVDEQTHLKAVLEQVLAERNAASDLFTERQVRLDLCLQLRLFEADVVSGVDCLRSEAPTPGSPMAEDPRSAVDIPALEEASAGCLAALHTAEEILAKGGELALAFESVRVNFPAGGPGSSDSGVGDSSETAVERIQRLITELAEAVAGVDEIRAKITAELDWRRLEQQSKQVLHWIGNCESMLHSTAVIPGSLGEADQFAGEHEKFRAALNEAHPEAVSCAARADLVLQAGPDHPRSLDAQSTMEALTARWRGLVYAAEERHKLLIAANNWYKTSDQVTSVLKSLEKEYRREEDWCQSEKATQSGEPAAYLGHLLGKHAEQKEAFLKACILARRTSECFLKYLHRQPPGTAGKNQVEGRIRGAMSELMAKEQAVLEAWAARKRRLDECSQFISLKTDAESLLSRPTAPTAAGELETELRRVLAAADAFEYHFHGRGLREITTRLQAHIPGKEKRDEERGRIANAQNDSQNRSSISSSGIGTSVSGRTSTASSGTATPTAATGVIPTGEVAREVQERLRLTRRRENILNELIQTEKAYVNDLSSCLESYYSAMSQPPTSEIQVPAGIVGREATIFCNMVEISRFHGEVFLRELEKYVGDFLPEDVGHCFVSHGNKLATLYVEYCVNKVESTQLVIEEAHTFFQEIQKFYGMSEPIQSYLIKPVQRITKYQLILKELLDCCDPGSAGELREGMEAMLTVPKKANDCLHLSMLQGLPEDHNLSSLGEVILQDQFTVWEPKQLIKKGRERRVFLFDTCLILAKELPSLPGEHKVRYQFKSRLLLAECNITEHIEGDQCKFALWTGRVPPISEYRLILKASSIEVKQAWVRAMREAMQERMFMVQSLYRGGQTGGKGDSDTSLPTSTTSSGASAQDHLFYITDEYKATGEGELSVSVSQRVELLDQSGDWALVRMSGASGATVEGHIPASLLSRKAPGRRGSTSSAVKKWLPANLRNKDKSAGKRGVKPEMAPPQAVVRPAPTRTPAVVESVLDNVSEESVEVELPPPMELQDFPVLEAAMAGPGENGYGSEETAEGEEEEEEMVSDQQQEVDELGLALETNLRMSRRPMGSGSEEATPGISLIECCPQVNSDQIFLTSPQDAGDRDGSPGPDKPNNTDAESNSASSQRGSDPPQSDRNPSSPSGGSSGGDGGEGREDRSEESPSVDGDTDEKTKLRKRRLQPIYELVHSEETYVNCLVFVREKYMTALEQNVMDSVPEDLTSKWPILWGNWAQLTEWHTTFLSRLKQLTESGLEEELDRIPMLFIDYTSRLRGMYSKYCENHRKAALIAEQYKDWFEEVRVRISDKEDIVSQLMRPVQRIMRYQLPMTEVVRLTDRLRPEMEGPAELWTRALEVMRQIPAKTQLIMEAARIDGYRGKITALGDMRVRGDLLLAKLPESGQGEDSLKFQERRVFLFEQAMLITETQGGGSGQYQQAAYLFHHAINVNKMRFADHWSPSSGGEDKESLLFCVTDTSPGKGGSFVCDPRSEEAREMWVPELDHLQRMQDDLLLALQDPKRFSTAGQGDAFGSAERRKNAYQRAKTEELLKMPPATGAVPPAPGPGAKLLGVPEASGGGKRGNRRKESCPTSINFGVKKGAHGSKQSSSSGFSRFRWSTKSKGNDKGGDPAESLGSSEDVTNSRIPLPVAATKKKHSILHSLFSSNKQNTDHHSNDS